MFVSIEQIEITKNVGQEHLGRTCGVIQILDVLQWLKFSWEFINLQEGVARVYGLMEVKLIKLHLGKFFLNRKKSHRKKYLIHGSDHFTSFFWISAKIQHNKFAKICYNRSRQQCSNLFWDFFHWNDRKCLLLRWNSPRNFYFSVKVSSRWTIKSVLDNYFWLPTEKKRRSLKRSN